MSIFFHPSFHSVELSSRLLLDWSPISFCSSWNVCDCSRCEEMATNDCDESEAAGNGDTVKQSPLFQSHVNFQFWEFTAGSLFYSWSEGPTGWHSCQSFSLVLQFLSFLINTFLSYSSWQDLTLGIPPCSYHVEGTTVPNCK